MSNRTYVPAAEIAKLIRQSLKEAAPGVKFSAYRDIPTIEQYRNGDCLNIPLAGVGGFSSEWNWSTQIWRVMAKASDRLALAPSKTADRLKFQGDDGYGRGTVGMPGDRMTRKGYPQTVGA